MYNFISSVKPKLQFVNPYYQSSHRMWKILPFYSLGVVTLFTILARLFYIQILNGKNYAKISTENRVRVTDIKAYRGVIKDTNGIVLVKNSPLFKFVAYKNFSEFPSIENKLKEKQSQYDYIDSVDKIIFYGLDRDSLLDFQSQYMSNYGYAVEADSIREYMYPNQTAHILGYVSNITSQVAGLSGNYSFDDKIGVSGIEKVYNNILHGRNGSLLYEADSNNKFIREISRIDPTSGLDLSLYINIDLQNIIYSSLDNLYKNKTIKGAAVVAQDPNTGGILAAVSYPSFNPNSFVRGLKGEEYNKLLNNPNNPFFNRIFLGQYPPGSVFKVVTSSALLEDKIVTNTTLVDAPGAINIGTYVYRDWNSGGHGFVSVEQAIAQSADTYFYKTVGGYSDFKNPLGPDKLATWAKNFGFGNTTGIDADYEASGLVPSPAWKMQYKNEQWYLGDTYIFAIGQSDLLATPLQVNQMMLIIANGGYLTRPKIAKLDNNPVGKIKVINPETVDIVKRGLLKACSAGGTAYPFFDFPIKHKGITVACKTGTSEFGLKNQRGEYETHAWFTVFAPADNPKIVLTVFLEGGGGGAQDAAPLAREILDKYIQ